MLKSLNDLKSTQQQLIQIEKTPSVLHKLEEWKNRVSASHLTSYIYNPVDFYLTKILGTRETSEMEEELSQRSYGNLVHYALQIIYEKHLGKKLAVNDLEFSSQQLVGVLNQAIIKLNHQIDFYEKGMNYIHKSIAERVLCVYAYAVLNEKKYPDNFVECGIWSFAEANKGVQNLQIYGEDEITDQSLLSPMNWVKNVIVEILNPASDFVEEVKQSW